MLITLPLIILTVVYTFCGFMLVLFLIGLVCVIVGVIKIAKHHNFYEITPCTKEAKKHKEEVEIIQGKPRTK